MQLTAEDLDATGFMTGPVDPAVVQRYGEPVDIRGETVGPATWKTLAIQIVVPLLAIVLLNYPARLYLHQYSWVDRIDYNKWSIMRQDTTHVDWLVSGDSTGLMGVMPQVLRHDLGGDCLNLSRNAAPICDEDAWIVSESVARRGPPKALILVYSYHTLQNPLPDWEAGMACLPLEFGFWARRNPTLPLTLSQALTVAWYHCFPFVNHRNELSAPFLKPGDTDISGFTTELLSSDGYLDAQANPDKVHSSAAAHLDMIANCASTICPLYQVALERLCSLAEKTNFQIYLAPGPAWQALRDNANFQKSQQALADLANRLAQEHPGRVHFVVPETRFFPADEMESDVHLTRPAAFRYSQALAQAVQRVIPASQPR